MGGLDEEKRDNEVLVMAFWTNSKGGGHVLVAWWSCMSTPQLISASSCCHTEESLLWEQAVRLGSKCHVKVSLCWGQTVRLLKLTKIRQATHTVLTAFTTDF